MPARIRLTALLLPALLLAALATSPEAQAGRPAFQVDSTNDTVDADVGDSSCADANGDCSLRAAIQESNHLAGADEIKLPADTYTLDITSLSGGGFGDTDAKGDLDITDSLTITGADQATTIVDGSGDVRVFEVTSTGSSLVIFRNLTITNGEAGDLDDGGGLRIASPSQDLYVTLDHVTVSNNFARYGGGIHVEGMARAEIDSSLIQDNEARIDGGGLNVRTGTNVDVNDSVIDGNQADSAAGIMNTDVSVGTLNVQRSQITHNVAATFGGGIFNGAYANITDTTINNNTATTNGGGGIYNASSNPLNVTSSTISNNVAGGEGEGGGAIEQDSDGEINIVNSTIADNDVGTVGGAILIQDLGAVYITSSTIANNSGDGGIYFRDNGPLSLADVIFENNGSKNCKREAGVTAEINSSDPYLADDSSCNADDLVIGTAGLGPLADNGGPTKTMAITEDSPAIDAGGAAHCAFNDQRGAHRLDGDGDSTVECDIGAFEFGYSVLVNGDLDCNAQLTPLDALPGLLTLAGLPAETGACPAPGAPVITGGGSDTVWGSLNCDPEFAETDLTLLLAATANIPPDSTPDCPAPGARVLIAPAPSS